MVALEGFRPTDEQLAVDYQTRGNEEAFEQLVSRHSGVLSSYLSKFGFGDVEDMCQETWMRASHRIGTYHPSKKFRAWLFTIAKNVFINSYRDEKRRMGERSLDSSPDDGIGLHGRTGFKGRTCLEAMAEKERDEEVRIIAEKHEELYLIKIKGLSHNGAAEVLSIPVGTVKSREHRQLKKLAEEIGSSFGEALRD
jgi:RNA polymerase sigma-70 factor, ECF subfamily